MNDEIKRPSAQVKCDVHPYLNRLPYQPSVLRRNGEDGAFEIGTTGRYVVAAKHENAAFDLDHEC